MQYLMLLLKELLLQLTKYFMAVQEYFRDICRSKEAAKIFRILLSQWRLITTSQQREPHLPLTSMDAGWLLILYINLQTIPNDGVSTLSWWWGLSAPETLRAMPAVV
jgi:hypothetical protein